MKEGTTRDSTQNGNLFDGNSSLNTLLDGVVVPSTSEEAAHLIVADQNSHFTPTMSETPDQILNSFGRFRIGYFEA
jgi:hypothetical protein